MDINRRIKGMTLEEKIGQKIMLDFRFWDPEGKSRKDMVAPDETVANIIKNHNIGGVILFANNLKNRSQIEALTAWYAAMRVGGDISLFISTDNEGGNVFRLPRGDYASFPGSMALAAAALEGDDSLDLAYEQGRQMASDLLSVHINTNFCPVVDVNTNPFNPIINVRAFSDNVETVSTLAEKVTAGMRQQGLITAYKHFPGHGNTATDSHTSLPRVDCSRAVAFAIDIAPYKHAIDSQVAPDMIMTAHIQYPSLDDSKICNQKGEEVTVPATMSREIMSNILRNQLGFNGVTISDALDMGAIVEHFSRHEAIERVFTAGVDIALMPISIASPDQIVRLSELIDLVVDKVRRGIISESEIDASVERILLLKQRYNLVTSTESDNQSRVDKNANLEKMIADRSITVVVNKLTTLPLEKKDCCYFVLTPWGEQARGIKKVMEREGYQNVIAAKDSELTDEEIKSQIRACDVFLLGTMSTSFSPVENDGLFNNEQDSLNVDKYLSYLRFASILEKKRVHLSLRAPYDIVNYIKYIDAAIAVYSYYGYDNDVWRGPSLISLVEILTGKLKPQGKLPIDIWYDYNLQSNSGTAAFARGFGLSW